MKQSPYQRHVAVHSLINKIFIVRAELNGRGPCPRAVRGLLTLTSWLFVIVFTLWLLTSMSAANAQSAHADGEIRKIDVQANRLIIKHGDWKGGMQMGAMTMPFLVRDPALLDGLKVADKVHIAIEKVDRDFIITAISRRPTGTSGIHVIEHVH